MSNSLRKDSHHSPHPSIPSSPLGRRPTSSSPNPKNNVDLKIVILGNGGVGKTSFVYRYINDNFAETISTIGASFVLKKWKSFYLGIWDTAGQEKFARISSYYSRGAQAAILAYDITDLTTFKNLVEYAKFLNDAEKDCYIVLIGTKLDLVKDDPERRQVTEEMAQEFASQYRAPCFETSAKDGLNVAAVFDTIGYHSFASKLSSMKEEEVNIKPVLTRAPSIVASPSESRQIVNRPTTDDKTCCCMQ